MKRLSRLFLKGLFAILPVVVTVSILYWLGALAESVLGGALKWLLPENTYWPGMGLICGIILVVIVGILLNLYVFRQAVHLFEQLLKTIPLVKVIYNSIKDIAKFIAISETDDDLQKAVKVTLDNGISLIGFVTCKSMPQESLRGLVAVYLPMSYQIGGYTAMLPRSSVVPLNISVQEAMQLVLTAAMTQPQRDDLA